MAWALGLLAVLTTAAFLVVNSTLPRYVDEADNLLGGSLVAHGARLYGDFFSHHMPVPYGAMALANRLGADSLVAYRLSFALLVVVVLAVAFAVLQRRLSPIFLATTIFSVGLGHPIYLGYMVLADHWFAYALLVLVLLVLAYDIDFGTPGQVVVAGCVFVALGSTLISIYPLVALAAYYVVQRWAGRRSRPLRWREELRFAGLIGAPFVVVGLLFAAQGTFGTFVQDALIFNQRYYARYDIGGDVPTMLLGAAREFGSLVIKYLRPTQWHEVESVLLVCNIGAVAVVARRSGRDTAGLYAALVFLSRMRGPGYHGAPYFVLSFISIGLVVDWACRTVWTHAAAWRRSRRLSTAPAIHSPRAIATTGAAVVALVYVALFYRDIGGFVRRLPRGEGLQSPYSAPVSVATSPADTIWVAPLDPSVYLDTGRRPASIYTYYHPWLAASPEITAAVLHDLQSNRPAVIVFEADKHIDWLFPVPTPAEYGASVYAYIQSAYSPLAPDDPLLRNVYIRNV